MIEEYEESVSSNLKGTIIDIETVGEFNRLFKYDSRQYKDMTQVIFGYINQEHLHIYCANKVTSSVLIRITNWVYSRFGIEGLRIFKDSTEEIVHTFWIDGTTYQNALELMENTPTRSTLGLEESLVSVASSYLQAYVFTFNNCFSELGIPVIPR